MTAVSCGGNANKKQSATEQAETAAPKNVDSGSKWPDNHFTQQVPKLDFAINSDDGSSFSASNEAGYRVELDLVSLKIGKQRADGYGIQ